MKYLGMDAKTGRRITDMDHIKQSVADIFLTRVGTRCMRRDYGSELVDYLHDANNDTLRLKLMAITYYALMRWEPRVTPQEINFFSTNPSGLMIHIKGRRTDNQATFSIDIPLGGRQ